MQGIAGDKGGSAPWLLGLWLSTQLHQDGTPACPIDRFHVVEDISNEPGALQVEIEICCSLQQHTWLRLAAGAAHCKLSDYPCPGMWAVGDGIKPHTLLFKLPGPVDMHPLHVCFRKIPTANTLFVCYC